MRPLEPGLREPAQFKKIKSKAGTSRPSGAQQGGAMSS